LKQGYYSLYELLYHSLACYLSLSHVAINVSTIGWYSRVLMPVFPHFYQSINLSSIGI